MSDPIPAQVGERIRQRRIAANLTQEEFATLADINPSQLGKYERGLNDPSVTTLVRIAGAFGIDPGNLIGGIGRDSLPAGESSRLTVQEYVAERERRGGRRSRRGRNRA